MYQVLDTRYILRVPSSPKNALLPSRCRSCGTTDSLHTSTIPALSLKLQRRKIKKNQLPRSSSSLCDADFVKLGWLHSYPSRSLRKSYVVKAQVTELASGIEVINNLGLDTLTFLGATVLIVPTFKAIKQSPVRDLQYHASNSIIVKGLDLGQHWSRNRHDLLQLNFLVNCADLFV